MAEYAMGRYVPSGSLAPYRKIMNSPETQALLLAKARMVAGSASSEGVVCDADVRPGRTRAHARATARPSPAGGDGRDSVARTSKGSRIDQVLLESLDAARG